MEADEAIRTRISCRAFRSEPVPEATVRAILEGAACSPSGGNLQPWHVYALTGEPLAALLADLRARMKELPRGEGQEYRVYPKDLKEPYASRRFKCGEDLYASISVARDDQPGRLKQFRRNFEFFGAPVGLFVYLDRSMGPPQWADCGMFLQALMLMARQHGLHTCAQEAWGQWFVTVAEHLDPPDDLMLFCGVALGYMDQTAPINRLRTERMTVEEFAVLKGF